MSSVVLCCDSGPNPQGLGRLSPDQPADSLCSQHLGPPRANCPPHEAGQAATRAPPP